jgi:tetratricopeptide (TPR) repeat protein
VILDRNFRNRGYLIDLADAQGEYGDALLRAGKNVEAHKLFEASLKNLDEAYQLIPDDIEHQALLASANERLGVVLLLVNQAAEARPFVEKAKELREELVRMERTNISRRMGMILSLAHAGNYKNAIATAKENFNSMENSTELTLQMARCFSLCSQESNPLVNLKETAEQTKVRKQESIKLALNALQRATRDGYKDAAVIEGEPDFAAIKDEPEFKDLIAAIKSRTK